MLKWPCGSVESTAQTMIWLQKNVPWKLNQYSWPEFVAINEHSTYTVIVVLHTIPCLTSLTVRILKWTLGRPEAKGMMVGGDGVVSTGWAGGWVCGTEWGVELAGSSHPPWFSLLQPGPKKYRSSSSFPPWFSSSRIPKKISDPGVLGTIRWERNIWSGNKLISTQQVFSSQWIQLFWK